MSHLPQDGTDWKSSLPSSSLLLLVEKIPAVLWTTNAALRFTSLAGAGLEAMNANARQYLGAPVTEFFPHAGAEITPLAGHQRALQGQASRFDIEMMGRALQAHVEPLRAPTGEVAGVIGVALDNTERQVAERKLRLSEQGYRCLIEEAPYAIVLSTVSGQFLQVNRAAVEMLGYESEAELLLTGLKTDIFARMSDYDRFLGHLQVTGSCQGFESVWRRHDGKIIAVSLGGRAVRNHVGRISYFEILAENITEKKQLEEQLRQAQKMQAVGQLAGGIAHDFNNLLTVIKGQLELTLSQMQELDPLRRRLQEVEKAADRAATLTRQLLAFSRMQVAESKPVDLNMAVAGMAQLLVRLIGENIDLTFVPEKNLGCVQADPSQIEQILMNLAVNAKDAMPAGGRLTIATSNVHLDTATHPELPIVEAGDYVLLSVTDTGHGISPETQARIYEPFYTTKKPGEGTGLGLFTVYGIVKQSKGYIYLESEPGKGATFRIYLPCVAGAPENTAPLAPLDDNGGTETILFAEDEESIRKLTSSYLDGLGYRVLTATDGVEAWQIAKDHEGKIDLLLTDAVMPRLGGPELAESLRAAFPELKVIIVSGYAGDYYGRDTLAESRMVFLQKPFSSMQFLAKKIREVLDESNAATA
jgi:two-component system cell cycle sensor histidine kinase/response regulator CckA